ncbi:hypothetical protein, partial [Frigidibacter oleivorans]|uniref:hypothetical protein n=1 Tax=Frigidibacter oleivorans TaxID=2487129 RepID=UPI000F8CBF94
MKPAFALDLAPDGIRLLQRTGGGWLKAAEVPLDGEDVGQDMAALRELAETLHPEGFTTKLLLPPSQILYVSVDAPGPDAASRRRQIARALVGRTPYDVEELVFDWSGTGPQVNVAVVARETLEEAEAFALEHMFNPVSFAAVPENGHFRGEPFFGQTGSARAFIPEGERLVRDQDPVRVTGALSIEELTALAATAGAVAEVAAPAAEPEPGTGAPAELTGETVEAFGDITPPPPSHPAEAGSAELPEPDDAASPVAASDPAETEPAPQSRAERRRARAGRRTGAEQTQDDAPAPPPPPATQAGLPGFPPEPEMPAEAAQDNADAPSPDEGAGVTAEGIAPAREETPATEAAPEPEPEPQEPAAGPVAPAEAALPFADAATEAAAGPGETDPDPVEDAPYIAIEDAGEDGREDEGEDSLRAAGSAPDTIGPDLPPDAADAADSALPRAEAPPRAEDLTPPAFATAAAATLSPKVAPGVEPPLRRDPGLPPRLRAPGDATADMAARPAGKAGATVPPGETPPSVIAPRLGIAPDPRHPADPRAKVGPAKAAAKEKLGKAVIAAGKAARAARDARIGGRPRRTDVAQAIDAAQADPGVTVFGSRRQEATPPRKPRYLGLALTLGLVLLMAAVALWSLLADPGMEPSTASAPAVEEVPAPDLPSEIAAGTALDASEQTEAEIAADGEEAEPGVALSDAPVPDDDLPLDVDPATIADGDGDTGPDPAMIDVTPAAEDEADPPPPLPADQQPPAAPGDDPAADVAAAASTADAPAATPEAAPSPDPPDLTAETAAPAAGPLPDATEGLPPPAADPALADREVAALAPAPDRATDAP